MRRKIAFWLAMFLTAAIMTAALVWLSAVLRG